ncbi:DUF3311 domain-containing protein [Catellatospora citrea]|uniref:DUF3311 domain-containing protein n=1 Tax=Catellatospora citrea TaxID=53366 RepID=A0A8J3KEQ2_9ACTN|nr:DUF3311 domain-containing protein [Catellatospora citrea]RKE07367.1 uncharacterized protein DUF3311 [Catellatospora citrea]GIF95523.1 hypothetical protein Cci01nite_06170 [Catellatospora citrea]
MPEFGARPARRGWRWLLLVPILAPLPVGLYNRLEPQLWGIPFFYWYQVGCAVLAMAVTTFVHRMTRAGR